MSKVLLELAEVKRINNALERLNYEPEYIEIEVKSVGGIGKVTYLTVPHTIEGHKGTFRIAITDVDDW